jgi:hypothetical protein
MSLFAAAKQARHQAAALRSFDDGGRVPTHAWHRAGSGDSSPSCDSGCGLPKWSDAGTFFPPAGSFSITGR